MTGFNAETDLEKVGERRCACGQRYDLYLYAAAREGQYATSARAVEGRMRLNEDPLDADEIRCVRCGEDVPFDGDLVEGPVTEAFARFLEEG